MRILVLDPYGDDAPRGNSVSTGRIVGSLVAAGHTVRRLVALGLPLTRALRATADFAPDVIHAIHAFRAAHLGAEVARKTGIPLVVSFRGTDAAIGLEHP